jgi:hypothetical protein
MMYMNGELSMKGKMKKMLIFSAFYVVFLLFTACTEPSPLYGTWSDNRGNTFSFYDNGTFDAKIATAGGVSSNYEGNYSVLVNAMTISCTNIELRIVTEWDIRGNMLYLDWTNEDGAVLSMTLYKVSN